MAIHDPIEEWEYPDEPEVEQEEQSATCRSCGAAVYPGVLRCPVCGEYGPDDLDAGASVFTRLPGPLVFLALAGCGALIAALVFGFGF